MRRTSSLGRRSSTQPLQFTNTDNMKSDDKKEKKSMILQPGFTTRGRSSEAINEVGTGLVSSVNKVASKPLKRSLSECNLNTPKTPVTPATPAYTLNSNLATGISRPQRSQIHSIEYGRMSSIGGSKILRKDTRPLSEKAFLNSAVVKIQNFFQSLPDFHVLFGDKIILSPMTTALFVNLVSYLTNLLGVKVIITRSNYQEELPNLMKKLCYRGKVERSWLITVNAPHSFQHVIGLLDWLVTVVQYMKTIDVESMMYPDNVIQNTDFDNEDEEGSYNFKFLKPYLMWYYQAHLRGCNEEVIHKQDDLLLNELMEKANLDNLEELEKTFNELKKQMKPTKEEEEDCHYVEELKRQNNILVNEKERNIDYIQKSRNYLESIKQQIFVVEENDDKLRKKLENKKAELEILKSKVKSQGIQLKEKEDLDRKRQSLQRNMKTIQESYKEIENLLFKEDILLVAARKKVDNTLMQYNKMIAENRAYEPRLKDAELEGNVLDKDAEQRSQFVDKFLNQLKSEYKVECEKIESKQEEVTHSINKIQKKLEAILSDSDIIQSEKVALEEEVAKYMQKSERERKEYNAELKELQITKNKLNKITNEFDVEDLEKKLEIKNSMLKDMHDDLIKLKQYKDGVRKTIEENKPTIQKKHEEMIARMKSLSKK